MQSKVTHPIDRLSAAESIATLLARIDLERLPKEEALAVGEAQMQAIDDWLAAYAEAGNAGGRKPPTHRSAITS